MVFEILTIFFNFFEITIDDNVLINLKTIHLNNHSRISSVCEVRVWILFKNFFTNLPRKSSKLPWISGYFKKFIENYL